MRITWLLFVLIMVGCGQPFGPLWQEESDPQCDEMVEEGQFVPPPPATVIVPIPKKQRPAPDAGTRHR